MWNEHLMGSGQVSHTPITNSSIPDSLVAFSTTCKDSFVCLSPEGTFSQVPLCFAPRWAQCPARLSLAKRMTIQLTLS